MARKSKTVYERIEVVKDNIRELEEKLIEQKEHLNVLLAEQDDLEMRQTWLFIKEKGISMEQLQKLAK